MAPLAWIFLVDLFLQVRPGRNGQVGDRVRALLLRELFGHRRDGLVSGPFKRQRTTRWFPVSATKRLSPKEMIEKMKWTNEISHKCRKFLAFSEFFSHFFQNLETFCHFLTISVKFRQNFIKILPKNRKIHRKTRMKWNEFFSFRQKFWRFFAEILRSERCKSMRIL